MKLAVARRIPRKRTGGSPRAREKAAALGPVDFDVRTGNRLHVHVRCARVHPRATSWADDLAAGSPPFEKQVVPVAEQGDEVVKAHGRSRRPAIVFAETLVIEPI